MADLEDIAVCDENECSICLAPMWWSHQLQCGHRFHSACLRGWKSTRAKAACPLCRGPLRPPPGQWFGCNLDRRWLPRGWCLARWCASYPS